MRYMRFAPLWRRAEKGLTPFRARNCYLLAAMLLIGSGIAWPIVDRAAAEQPNVILIITDDQGYGDVGAHGNSMIQTPNLDKLHDESFRLTNFHVDPTCAETRSALMTGRYSCRTGVWHTIMGRSILRRDEVTMADVFRANGYQTGMFGKWHLGDNYPYRPENRGFQEVVAHGGGGVGQTPDLWGNDYFDDQYFHNGVPEQQEGYCTDVFFSAAKRFIRQEKDRPFFCYISTNAPHGPFNVDDKYADPYREQGVPETMSRFYGMITNIDENVGELRDMLEQLEIADHTLLIFMTDNGTAAGINTGRNAAQQEGWQGFNAGMNGKKGSQYDGGHRVPLFMSCPDLGISRGESNRLTAHIDLLPSLIEWCGLTAPRGVSFDGSALSPVLNDEDEDFEDRMLVVHSQRIDHPEKWRKTSVMSQRWRLVDGVMLYDMSADPGQKNDVAANNEPTVSAMREFYDEWWQDVSSRFDEYVTIDIGNPESGNTLLTSHDWHPEHGGVPWNQNMIRQELIANGHWVTSVVEDGKYRFTLRTRPPGIESQLSSADGVARVQVGNQDVRANFKAGDEEVSLEMELKAGQHKLQTWLTTDTDKTRGAYFVEIEKLEEASDDDNAFLFEDGDRIALVGGTWIERMQVHNYFESLVLSARPDSNLSFRNLGWSGDDVFGTARAVFGGPEDGYQRRMVDLQKANPTVVILAYGGNEAFDGEANINRFLSGYRRLIEDVRKLDVRIVLVSPHRLEYLGSPLPDPLETNRLRAQFGNAIHSLAAETNSHFIDFYEPLADQQFQEDGRPIIRDRLTDDGIHFNEYGYWRVAPDLAKKFGIELPAWDVQIDLNANRSSIDGGELERLGTSEGVIEFETNDETIPYSAPPAMAPRGGRMMARHDVIRIQGLPAGRYGLQIDDQPTILATDEQWRDGVYLIRSHYIDQADTLRKSIAQKNELFFHRHRPQNETYLFLFRKHEQGNNAVEIEQFIPLVEEQEKSILDNSKPRRHRYRIVRVDD